MSSLRWTLTFPSCREGIKNKRKGASSKLAAPGTSKATKAVVRNVAAPKASQILSDLESLHQRTSTQNKMDPAQRLNIASRSLKPSAANSKRKFPEPDGANTTPKAAVKLTPESSLSTNPDSDDAELDPSFFFRRPKATKRALSYDQDNTKPRKKAKVEDITDNKSNQRFPPVVERTYPSSSEKKPMFKGSLTRVGVKGNGSEVARTAPTLKSSSPCEKLFFSDGTDQEPAGLERSPGSGPEYLQDYQGDHLFEFDADHFEVTPSSPAPEVETAVAHPEGPSGSKPSTENDAKDDDDGVHDWYKAVAGDDKAFDRLFSSIVFVDEPFE